MTIPRPAASDFPPAVMRLFDDYVHGRIDRRGFLDPAAASLAWQRTLALFNAALAA